MTIARCVSKSTKGPNSVNVQVDSQSDKKGECDDGGVVGSLLVGLNDGYEDELYG